MDTVYDDNRKYRIYIVAQSLLDGKLNAKHPPDHKGNGNWGESCGQSVLLTPVFSWQRAWIANAVHRARMIGRVRTLSRELLVMVESIREECMVGGHHHLHRLNDPFEMLNTPNQLLRACRSSNIATVGLSLLAQTV